ncbi:MAG TPA: hypothetical protein VF316_07525 [Polyangiaceae bacterium]
MSGLIIAAVVIVAVVLLLWLMIRAGGKMAADEAARLATAQPGTATVTEVHRRGIRQDSRHVVMIMMRVKPATGEPYDATTSWWLDVLVMPRVQPGMDVAVKIDATDPARVYPDDKSWPKGEAEYHG